MSGISKPRASFGLLLATVLSTTGNALAQPRLGQDQSPCDGPAAARAPADFALTITDGGGPGSGFRSRLTIDAAGVAVARSERPRTKIAASETRRRLSRAALDRIWSRVVACRFFELDKAYATRGILDGWGQTVTVSGGGRSHTVSVYMYRLDRLNQIVKVAREAVPQGR